MDQRPQPFGRFRTARNVTALGHTNADVPIAASQDRPNSVNRVTALGTAQVRWCNEGTGTRPDYGGGTRVQGGDSMDGHRNPTDDQGRPADGDTSNTIAGNARIWGPTLQARDVHGGVHLHARPTGPPAPRQLPSVTAHFASRAADLARLDATLADATDDAPTLVVVSGQGGIGKSSLAIRWLRGVGERFPDGQFFADLRGHTVGEPTGPGEVLAQFLRALGIGSPPADLGERAALWRSATADLRIAVLLDDAISAAQVRALLPGSPHALVVTTARRRLSGLAADGAVFHHVPVLDVNGGVELLTRAIGRQRVTAELEAAQDLVRLCAGLPLALSLVTARLATRPRRAVRSLVDLLAGDAGRLSALELEGNAAVRTALDASYAELSPEAARLYRTMGWLPLRTFDGFCCAAAGAMTVDRAERLLDELMESNLVEELDQDLCRFHDLVRDHAAEVARREDAETDWAGVMRAVCDALLAAASAIQRQLTPAQAVLDRDYAHQPPPLPRWDDDATALSWLNTHHANLMALIRAAGHEGLDTSAWQLVDALWPYFQRFRQYELWIEAHRIGLAAAERIGDATAVRQMLNSGAIGLTAAGALDEAIDWYERSARAAGEAGDVRDEGQALHGMGSCHRQAGRPSAAVPLLLEAIALWEDCGYRRGTALSRIVLGQIALDSGDPVAATDLLTTARNTLVEVDNDYEVARAVALLGGARVRAGAVDEGLTLLSSAAATFAAANAALWEARTLVMLGEGLAATGDRKGAAAHWERAAALYAGVAPAEADRVRRRLGEFTADSPGSTPHGD